MKVKGIWSMKRRKKNIVVIEILTEKGNEQFDLSIKTAEMFSVDLQIMLKRLRRKRFTKERSNEGERK